MDLTHFFLRCTPLGGSTGGLRATTACTFLTSQLLKVVREWCVLCILTWKCASGHNGVHFFDISTSKSAPKLVCFVHFDLEIGNVLRAPTACTFSTSPFPKAVRTWGVFSFFTYKCASRHNGVHFFDISTSKSAPRMVCFVHFDLEMCFAPQRRALFRHLNFQKCSEAGVLCTFWLGNWKCASRPNGVHFFDISISKSGPNVRCF